MLYHFVVAICVYSKATEAAQGKKSCLKKMSRFNFYTSGQEVIILGDILTYSPLVPSQILGTKRPWK